MPLIDRDEPRFAEASREMRQSGDFLVPRLNGEYRFDKPPLIYWCQVLSYDGWGETDFAARFPSVIFAALASVATWIFSSRIFGPRVGIWSGIIFATSLQVFIQARAATADMPLVLFFSPQRGPIGSVQRMRNPHSGGGHSTFLSASASSPKALQRYSLPSSPPSKRFSIARAIESTSNRRCGAGS